MDLPKLVRWVHHLLDDDELASQLDMAHRREIAAPGLSLTEINNGKLCVGLYFLRLPGAVATLGGLRFEPGFEEAASRLLQQAIRGMYDQGVEQVQAINSVTEQRNDNVLSRSMNQIATFAHIFRHRSSALPLLPATAADLKWRHANEFSACRIASLIAATFEGTLDCPELNGIRTAAQVLDGFLDGVALRLQAHWLVVEVDGELAGCLLLSEHRRNSLLELCYVGLKPKFRRRGMGRALIQEACRQAEQIGCEVIAAAVDVRNTPALKVYSEFSFRVGQQLRAWLHPR